MTKTNNEITPGISRELFFAIFIYILLICTPIEIFTEEELKIVNESKVISSKDDKVRTIFREELKSHVPIIHDIMFKNNKIEMVGSSICHVER